MSEIEEVLNKINWITLENTKNIMNQMENNLYIIQKSDGQEGIGFFTKINLPFIKQSIQVLITHNDFIDDSIIQQNNQKIKVIQNKKLKEIKLDNRIIYSNKEYNITFIEVKEKFNCFKII